MKAFLFLIILLCIFEFAFISRKKKELQSQICIAISREKSQITKVWLVLCVVVCHLGIALGQKIPMSGYLASIGTPAVSMFLFLSGYGLLKSFCQKGPVYLESFFEKRIIKIIVPFIIACLLSFIIDYKLGEFNYEKYLIGYIEGFPPMPNSWYVYELLFLYLVFYLSFKYIKNKKRVISILLAIIICFYVMIKSVGWPGYWYSSILSFPMGMMFATKEKEIGGLLYNKEKLILFVLTIISIVLLSILCINDSPESTDTFIGFISMLFIPIAIAFLLIEISFKPFNNILKIGSLSYEIYLVHGLIIEIASQLELNVVSFIALVLPFTLIFASILRRVSNSVFQIYSK